MCYCTLSDKGSSCCFVFLVIASRALFSVLVSVKPDDAGNTRIVYCNPTLVYITMGQCVSSFCIISDEHF